MSLLKVTDLKVSYGGIEAVKGITFEVPERKIVTLIGANGAGKSTFLKILSGEVEPTGGHVHIDPKARMSVLKQNQSMYDEYTVMDTVIMGNKRLYEHRQGEGRDIRKARFLGRGRHPRQRARGGVR